MLATCEVGHMRQLALSRAVHRILAIVFCGVGQLFGGIGQLCVLYERARAEICIRLRMRAAVLWVRPRATLRACTLELRIR